jgi:hypothetical protein
MDRKLLLHCKIVKLPVKPAPSSVPSCGPKWRQRPGARSGKLLPYMEGGGGRGGPLRVEKNLSTLCTYFESRVPLGKMGHVIGAARKKLPTELNRHLGITMGENTPNRVGSELALKDGWRKRQISVIVNRCILMRGTCLIHEVYIFTSG